MDTVRPFEQRKYERIKLSMPVNVSLKYVRKEFFGRTLDITEEGVSLIADQPVSVGTALGIDFLVDEISGERVAKKLVHIEGIVYSVSPWQLNDYRLGIYFGQADEERENKFYDIICSSSAEQAPAQIQLRKPAVAAYGRHRFLWQRLKPHAFLSIFSGFSL